MTTATEAPPRVLAWQGAGQVVHGRPGVGLMELADEAGLLNWDLRTEPCTVVLNGKPQTLADKRMVARGPKDGTGAVLGITGTRYFPLAQELWLPFVQDILAGSGEVSVDAIGSVDMGRIVWVALAVEGIRTVGTDGDRLARYLMVGTSHDGSTPLSVVPMLVRLSCTNQVRGLLGNRSRTIYRVRHLSGARDLSARAAEARIALGIGDTFTDDVVAEAERMLKIAVSDAEFDSIIRAAFPEVRVLDDPERVKAGGRKVTMAENRQDDLRALWQHEIAKGTGWGAVNAVGEYLDWTRSVRGGDRARQAMVNPVGVEETKARAYRAITGAA